MENEFIYSEEFQAYGDNLKNSLTDYVTLESIILDGASIESGDKATPIGCMQEFLDAASVGDKDTAMKKLFAAGIVMANDAGALPFELSDTSPEEIAVVVDDSLTRAKIAYNVATGEIPAEEVADFLIDQAAARAMAMADIALDHPEASVELACNAISLAFPPVAEPVQMMKPILKRIAKEVAPEAKEYIHEGINLTAQFAKKLARVIIGEARKEMQGTKVENPSLNAAAV